MITDNNLRLSGATSDGGLTWTPQGVTAAAWSSNVVDLADRFNLSDGEDLEVHIATIQSAGTAATPNATVNIELYSFPFSTAALSGTVTSVAYPSSAEAVAGVFAGTTNGYVFTKAGHGLQNGTRVTLGTAIGTTLVTAAWHYVINVTADTFQLSATPNGAVATWAAVGAAGTVTVTWYAEHLGTLTLPIDRLAAGTGVTICPSPAFQGGPFYRYFAIYYNPSTTLNAGTFIADVVYNSSDSRKHYPNGFTIL